jgi:hypothetical protein
MFVVLVSSTRGDIIFVKPLGCADHHPIRVEDEQERLLAAWPVMKRNWGPRWKKKIPGERPLETAELLHTSPQSSRHVRRKGTAPLSGPEEQTARAMSAYVQCACLLPLQMEYKLD